MRKKYLAVLLIVALLLTMLPCGVFALDGQDDNSYSDAENIYCDENSAEALPEERALRQSGSQSIAAETTNYSTEYPNTHVNTGNQAYDICCIALTQLGYTETYDNHTKYTAWLFGSDLAYAWCGIFISWCAGQAGVSDYVIVKQGLASGYNTGNMSQNPYGCPAYAFGATEAKMGDIAFIGSGTSNHVGLVIGTSASYIWCVEGNDSDTVALRCYDRSSGYQSYGSTRILFYARPNYSGTGIAVSGITVDDNGNVTYDGGSPSDDPEIEPEPDPDPDPEPTYDYCKFTDVPGDTYYSEAVLWASENGYATGMTDTTFEPYRECTRAQVITFLWRLAGSPTPTQYQYYYYWAKYNFIDVAYGTWYYNAVVWATNNGIASGMTNYTFEPDSICTRGQAVTFLYRLIGSPGYSDDAADNNAFEDIAYGDWYYDAVLWASEQGIAYGMTVSTYEPATSCIRGQIVTFMYRVYQKYQYNFS